MTTTLKAKSPRTKCRQNTPRVTVLSNRVTPKLMPGAAENKRCPEPADTQEPVVSEISTQPLSGVDPTRPDALASYKRALGEVPLITTAQEEELAARIHRGGAAALCSMIRANLRVVIKIGRERIRQLENLALNRLRRLLEERDCVTTAA